MIIMAGLMTHLIVAVLGSAIAWLMFKEWKYGLGFFLGHLGPDLIDFGITGLKIGSMNPSVIMGDSWFYPLMVLGHTIMNWAIFGIIIIAILMLLYKFKKIPKKAYLTSIMILVFLLIGIAMHLIFDMLIIEHSYWI
jgi:hypothetical protein